VTTLRGSREATREFVDRGPLTSQELAQRVASDIPAGSYVNLGIGQPTAVADYLAENSNVVLHTENGMLGMGPRADGPQVDPDLVNAGKIPVTALAGAAYFHQADSFAMMRGGHIDICVLGAYQVSGGGDLANWHTDRPGAVPAVGGAMDLAVGARTVYVMMSLFDKSGNSKLVSECTYPLTGRACVDRIYSEYAVVDVGPDGVVVHETYGSTVDQLAKRLPVELLRL